MARFDSRKLLEDNKTFVVNVDCLYPCSTRMLCESVPNKYEFVKGDITTPGLVLQLLLLYDIDTVFHLAAQSHVCTSFSNPRVYIKDNVLGTNTVLDAIRECHAKSRFTKPRLLMMSTDEVCFFLLTPTRTHTLPLRKNNGTKKNQCVCLVCRCTENRPPTTTSSTKDRSCSRRIHMQQVKVRQKCLCRHTGAVSKFQQSSFDPTMSLDLVSTVRNLYLGSSLCYNAICR